MHYSMVRYVQGQILRIEGALLLVPALCMGNGKPSPIFWWR